MPSDAPNSYSTSTFRWVETSLLEKEFTEPFEKVQMLFPFKLLNKVDPKKNFLLNPLDSSLKPINTLNAYASYAIREKKWNKATLLFVHLEKKDINPIYFFISAFLRSSGCDVIEVFYFTYSNASFTSKVLSPLEHTEVYAPHTYSFYRSLGGSFIFKHVLTPSEWSTFEESKKWDLSYLESKSLKKFKEV